MKKIFEKNIQVICMLLSVGALWVFTSGVSAQSVNPKIDSMKLLLHGSKADTTRFRLHFFIAQLYLKDGVYDSQYVHASAALLLAEKISTPTLQQKKFKAGALRVKGIYFRTRSEFEKAITFYLEALKEFESINDSNGVASTINSIGIAYLALKRYDEAYEYFKRAYDLDRFLKKPEKEVADLTNMAYALHGNGNRPDSFFNKALKLGINAMEIAKTLNDKHLMASCAESIALSLFHLNKYSESMIYHQQALAIAEELKSNPLIVEQLYLMAQLCNYMEQYPQAIEYGLRSERLAREESLFFNYPQIFDALATSYEKTGNYKKALEYSQKLNAVLDSTYQTQITDQLKRFESDKKDNEIALLSANNQLKETETKKQRQLKNIFIVGAALLLLFAFVLINRYQIKQRSEKELAEKNKIIEKEKQRAEQSEQFKSQFLANMSHEIRTPMNAVIGVTNLMLDEPQAEKNLRYLNVIKHSSENLLVVINDILDLSKLEAGKMSLEKIPFRIEEVITSVYDTLQLKAEEKGLKFIIDTDKNVPAVLLGDPARLTQVLLNLAGNAVKFTERGSVTISVIARSEGSVLSEGATKQSQTINDAVQSGGLLRRPAAQSSSELLAMTFSITDTGIGIEKEKLKTIFESFTQAHMGDTRRYGGTGLGLTISRNLVELSGGKLEVESETGAGSVFSFTIPFEISTEGAYDEFHLQKDGFSADDLFGLKILIAEDNEHNQLVTVDTLKKVIEDVEVDVVKNGREVLDFLDKQMAAGSKPYDLILMDVQMPEMDGYEATRQIRNPESAIRNPNIPIIALTASVVRSDLIKCIEAGMNSYIPKPFTKEGLVKEIGRVLQRNTKGNKPATSNHSPNIFRQSTVNGRANFTHLQQISDGDTQKMKEYLEQFLGLVPLRLQQLKISFEKENRAEVYHAAHTLKPQLGFFGLKQEELIANTIEMKAHEISPNELSDLVSQLEAGCSAAILEVETELKRIA